MLTEELNDILDSNCIDLLNELETTYDIQFKKWTRNYAETFTQNKLAVISYNPKLVTVETIVHELLHVWLNKFNYLSANHLLLSYKSDPPLSRVFNKTLCDHIGNCMDHHKMYPMYKSMGYSPEKFIKNGGEKQCSVASIRTTFMKINGRYTTTGINYFIGHLVSIYADHCDNDYKKHLRLLKKKDNDLFMIVTDFWNSWEQFDIKNIDPIHNSDYDLYEKFMSQIEDWILSKKVVAA